MIFCEAAAIYGVIVTIILQTKLEEVPRNADGSWPSAAMFSGYSLLAAGLTTGFANLACGCVSISPCSAVHVLLWLWHRLRISWAHKTYRCFSVKSSDQVSATKDSTCLFVLVSALRTHRCVCTASHHLQLQTDALMSCFASQTGMDSSPDCI